MDTRFSSLLRAAAVAFLFAQFVCSQGGAPVVTAHVKGPNEVSLTWGAVADPGYGYLVEVQSAGDTRYSAWTELQPVPTASGYTCDSTVIFRGGRCIVSDASGTHVYNPPTKGVPYWVTEGNYVDPRDGSPAQFIAWGLKPGTEYQFRVRTYSGNKNLTYGSYSNVATVRTAAYPARYVSTAGNDGNDGKAADPAHAWRTLAHATRSLACGEVLLVAGGIYASDVVRMGQRCTADARAVVLVNPGETATLTSQPPGAAHAMEITGNHVVIDGLAVASPATAEGEYDVELRGLYNALLNVDIHAPVTPSFKWGVSVYGSGNLIYRSYLHDYGSPDSVQNSDGNGGFVLVVTEGGTGNVIWSNHLTRGGHDTSMCHRGCFQNQWLNNVMDGGWGQGFIAGGGTSGNLYEGNVIKGTGQLVPFYKPAIQVSGAGNTIRRNVVVQSRTWALENSAFGPDAGHNLVYNNTIYASGGCYFQSANKGYRAYYFDVMVNNICYRPTDLLTRIYVANVTNRIVNNSFLAVDGNGKPAPDKTMLVWNQLGGPQTEGARSLAGADRGFAPVFARNAGLSVLPGFVDEAGLDFHLAAGSPLVETGLPVSDARYGWTSGPVDIGAYGIKVASEYRPEKRREEEVKLRALRAAKPAHGRALEAAMLRSLDRDEAAAELMKGSSAADWMERFERVQQGGVDAGLWDALASQPDRILEMADAYLEWGLLRDALEVAAHRYPPGSAAMTHPLLAYYRAFLRDRLDYSYYAMGELKTASALPPGSTVPHGAMAAMVLRYAVQLDPMDASARYLLAAQAEAEGRVGEARDQLRAVLQLKPGQPDAATLIAKLPAEAVPARSARPAAVAGGTAAPAAAGNGPREIAAQALLAAASGDLNGAARYFTPANFTKAKQEDAVREAYFEVRLQRLVNAAAARQCNGMDQAIGHLGDEDGGLAFTFGGFGGFMKSLRYQYLLGYLEFQCMDEAAGKKRWERVAKATPVMNSVDYAYSLLALNRLSSDDAHGRARTAMNFVKRQLDAATPATKGIVLFNVGYMQLVLERRDEALTSFRAGAEAGPAGMVEYLNRDAIRTIDQHR